MAAKPKIRATFMMRPELKMRLSAASEASGRSALHIMESALDQYLAQLEADQK